MTQVGTRQAGMVINFILNPPRHYWIPFRP